MVVPVGNRSISTTRDCFESFLSVAVGLLADVFFCRGNDGLAATFRAAVVGTRFLADFGIGIFHLAYDDLAPSPPKPQLRHQAGGAGTQSAVCVQNSDTTALIGQRCQSFMSNVIADLERS